MAKNAHSIPMQKTQNPQQANHYSQNSPPLNIPNSFQGAPFRGSPPQMQQSQPVYVLNQQNNRNFTVQPFPSNRPQVQSFFK